ncbi:PREDICTED: uncharacterized protein LOC104595339 isoform X2 [Nelumbo nucifera]|uniref:Uncharacterized protein LOC104595339 isoform X2 n=2 Tax=Nelumbo nucifera TaxID=4432 RepID=A0A1U8Q4N6_NELNU|nr:PREDICTED: uncharacterized protein LOC104595339 isoform X2 [Nelumbo nucifera]
MKEPPLSRRKEPPSVQKIKILCSFNGAFEPRPPSGKLRYIGGETRIVSIDRSIGLSRFRSKIRELCPNIPSFSLKYQLHEPEGPDGDAPLVLIATDDDFLNMFDEYDKMESDGKLARLWVFVCIDNGYVGLKNGSSFSFSCAESGNMNVRSGIPQGETLFHDKREKTRLNISGGLGGHQTHVATVFSSDHIAFLNPHEPRISVNVTSGTWNDDDSLRKRLLEQRVLTTHETQFQNSFQFLHSEPLGTEVLYNCPTGTERVNKSLKEVTREAYVPTHCTATVNSFGDSCSINIPVAHMSSQGFGTSIPLAESRLQPFDVSGGDIGLKASISMQLMPRGYGGVLIDGCGDNVGRSYQSVATVQLLNQSHIPNVISTPTTSNVKQGSKNGGHVSMGNFNRENVMPLTGDTHLPSVSCSNPLVGKVSPLKSSISGNRNLDCHQLGIRNHRFGIVDIRNHRISAFSMQNHQNYPPVMVNHHVTALDGKSCPGKCYAGLRPSPNISKHGQGARSHYAQIWKPWPASHDHTWEGMTWMLESSKNTHSSFNLRNGRGILRERIAQPIGGRYPAGVLAMKSRNPIPHVGFHGLSHGTFYQPLCSDRVIEDPVLCFRPMTTSRDLSSNLLHAKFEVPSQAVCNNFHGMSGSTYHSVDSKPGYYEFNRKPFFMAPQKDVEMPEYSTDAGHVNSSELGCSSELPSFKLEVQVGPQSSVKALTNDCDGFKTLSGDIATSVDISLCKLSLSPSKEAEPPALPSSPVRDDLSEPLARHEMEPQINLLDFMGEEKLSSSSFIEESSGVAFNSFVSGGNVSKSLPRHEMDAQINSFDIIDVGKLNPGPLTEKLERIASNSEQLGNHISQRGKNQQENATSLSIAQKVEIKGSIKCSNAIGGVYSDLAMFYTHLATKELQTIKNSDLEDIRELGSGTYGTVFYGKWKGSDVAIKRIKPSCFVGSEKDRLIADFWKEAHMLSQLHHPNVLAFYGVVTDGQMINLATVTEYMVNGSLKQVLRRKDRTIDRKKRLIIAMDAAFGVEYLHEKNIVHFDLKSHNFLVNMRDPQRPVCKIGDLGLSKIKQKTLVSGGVRGTIPWMAPELLRNKENMVTEKVDVYSFGIVMWELLTGDEPYADLRSEGIIAGIIKGDLRPEVPSWCDPAWRSLMERCWSSDPDSRPAFSEISKELRAMSAAMNIRKLILEIGRRKLPKCETKLPSHGNF